MVGKHGGARRGAQLYAGSGGRLSELVEKLLRKEERLVLRRLGQHDCELLPSGPGYEVDPPGGLVEQRGDATQCSVAGSQTETLVYPLEAIQIEDDDADSSAVRLRALDLTLQDLVEGRPVRQPGEWVGPSRIGEATQEPLDPATEVGEQRRRRDERSESDHQVMNDDVRATWRIDRGDRDDRPVVHGRPEDVDRGIAGADREVEDVEADPYVEECVAAGRVPAEV